MFILLNLRIKISVYLNMEKNYPCNITLYSQYTYMVYYLHKGFSQSLICGYG